MRQHFMARARTLTYESILLRLIWKCSLLNLFACHIHKRQWFLVEVETLYSKHLTRAIVSNYIVTIIKHRIRTNLKKKPASLDPRSQFSGA